MIVRRLLTGVLLTGLAAPLLAAAPHAREPRALPDSIPAPPPGAVSRVFARAEQADPSPAPAASAEPEIAPVPASSVSPEVGARARAEFEANRSGRIDRTRYTADMSARISDTALAEVSAALKPLGAVRSFTQVRKITQGAQAVYVFRIEFDKPPAVEQAIGWNAAGKIDYLQFRQLQ